MSWLANLMDSAKSFLDSHAAPKPNASDSIKQDGFDHDLFDDLKADVPMLQELIDDIGQKHDFAEDMVRDTVMQFWKGDPMLRDASEMDEGHLINHAVSSGISAAPETAETRSMTTHDRYGSAMASVAVTKTIKDGLAKHKEVKEAADAAKQKAAEEAAAAGDVGAAMAALQGAMSGAGGQPGGMPSGAQGPMTPQQAAAAQALADAIAKANAAQTAQQQAAAQAQAAAQQAAQSMKPQINQAIKGAGEDLSEEQQLFAAWGVGDGELKAMPYAERAALASSLRGNRLNKFRQLIGRFRMMAAAQRHKKIEYGRDQVVGVELSGDLNRVMPSEFALFAAGGSSSTGVSSAARRHLRRDFLVRFVEERLLSKKFEGIEKVGKGAIICLIDCSGSMSMEDKNGLTREAWAKAMALALLDQARHGKRDFVAINFSSRNQIKIWKFPKGEGRVTDIMEFAEHFWGGGTDYESPLNKATDLLEAEFNDSGKQKGDLIMLTDDECYVSQEWQKEWLARKEKLGFRLFGVGIGISTVGGAMTALADNVRTVDDFLSPSDSVSDIFQTVT